MKYPLRSRGKIPALLLSAVLLLAVPPNALAMSKPIPNVGTLFRENIQTLGDKTRLIQTTLQHSASGLQEERYIEWGPGSGLTAIAAYGGAVHGSTLTLSALQQRMQSQGVEMVAAMNGDYFSLNNGVPCGGLITDGILRATDNYERLIGFPSGGGAFISSSPMYTSMTVQIDGQDKRISIDQVNHTRTSDRLILYTPDFGATTQTTAAGVHVVLNVTGQLKVNGSVTGTVDSILTGTAACPLRAGQMVLSVTDTGPKSRLEGLAAGMPFTVSVYCSDNRLNNCPNALGANQKLLTGGQVVSGLETGTAPRTAVGVKEDGSCVFYTVDGRQPGYSVGLTLTDVAVRLQSLGCVEAVNLDGGGSTILGARFPGQNTITVTGRPSDGAQRPVANYIALVNNTPKLGEVGRLFVYPNEAGMLKGAVMNFSATASDINYHPLSVPPVTWWTDDTLIGTVDGGGRFTALSAGECAVAATGGNVTGGALVRVVERPDAVQVIKSGAVITALSAAPGEKVSLTARAIFENLPLISQNTCFTWTVDGQIGTVSAGGEFTAAERTGVNGTITIECGGVKAVLPVTVGTRPAAAETFEDGGGRFNASADGIGFKIESDPDLAQYGLRSGRITYDFGETGTSLALPANVPLPSGSAWLNLWVSGDKTGNRLQLSVSDAKGNVSSVSVCTMDFTGYKFFQLKLPSSASKVSAVRVVRADGGAAKGSFLTDQWVASAQRYDNKKPPAVSLDSVAVDDNTVKIEAKALDAAGLPLAAGNVTLLWDGAAQKISYSTITGKISLSIPLTDSLPHRLTLEAVDPCGSRSRVSRDVNGGDGASPYGDVPVTHWAADYIAFLQARGVLNAPAAAGFAPDSALTRADMAVWAARVLKLDLSKYDNINLPFTDLDRIPAGALREIRALYALGVVKGKNSEGNLYFDPGAPITRSEFCALLGRTMPRGYAQADLAFTDTGRIQYYAERHIRTFVSLGFIDGYPDGAFRPTGHITRAEAAKILYMFY